MKNLKFWSILMLMIVPMFMACGSRNRGVIEYV